MVIPKIIHYCWFGGKPLPEEAKKCIDSWKKYLPDYEIKEWNESNFDINSIAYTAEAYEARKYAFVSDYARYKILYEHGGIYFDTDVEVIAPMDDLLAKGPFMGQEDYLSAISLHNEICTRHQSRHRNGGHPWHAILRTNAGIIFHAPFHRQKRQIQPKDHRPIHY